MASKKSKKKHLYYQYEGISSSPISTHIHSTRILEGEIYYIAKTDDPKVVNVNGKLGNSSGGFDIVIDKKMSIDEIKPFLKRLID